VATPRYPGDMSEAPVARVVRALTSDRQVRLAALDASPLWDGVRRGHPHLEAEACAALTELLTANAILQARSMLQERTQLLLKGAGRARAVVADAWPDGTLRGVLDTSTQVTTGPWIAAPGLMQVMRSNPSGQPYIGNLPLVEGGISQQLEAYLQISEQIQASLTLWCDPATGEAGGLLVEPLPDCPPERLARVVQGIDNLDVVPNWERTTDFLIQWMNQGPNATILSTTELTYRCRCTREALLGTLQGFSAAQKADLFTEGEPIEVRCDYCGTAYHLHRADLERP
jgi:molecular chaperone Hsp33